MYRIELAPGEEAIFKTIDELVTGVRAGLILDTARIHHKATDKWLPIDLHPHYKIAKAKASAAPPAEPPPAPSASPLRKMPLPKLDGLPLIVVEENSTGTAVIDAPAPRTQSGPMLLRDAIPAVDDSDLDTPPPYVPDPEELADSAPVSHTRSAPAASGRSKQLGIVIGAVVLVGAGAAWTAMRPSTAKAPPPAPETPRQLTTSFASNNAPLHPLTVAPTPAAASAPTTLAAASARADSVAKARQAKKDSVALAAELPSAPSLAASVSMSLPSESAGGNGGAVTPAVLTQRYAAAYAAARAELDRNLGLFGFAGIFGAAHLSAGDGVPASRTAVNAAENYVRAYRKRTESIERAFQDSLDIYSKRYNWSAEQAHAWQAGSQAEGADVQVVATSLLKATDAVFDLLAAEAGQYKVSGNSITFQDAQAAREYGQLRQQVNQLLASRSASASSSMGRLVRAIGGARLPQEP